MVENEIVFWNEEYCTQEGTYIFSFYEYADSLGSEYRPLDREFIVARLDRDYSHEWAAPWLHLVYWLPFWKRHEFEDKIFTFLLSQVGAKHPFGFRVIIEGDGNSYGKTAEITSEGIKIYE